MIVNHPVELVHEIAYFPIKAFSLNVYQKINF